MLKSNYSARSILLSLGTGETQATAAIMGMQLPPAASDPDASATIVIVQSMQRGMRQLGCPLKVNGVLDRATQNCLVQVGGPRWENKTWLTLGKDIVTAREAGNRLTPPPSGMQGVGAVGFGGQAGGLLLLAGVAYLALKFKK